MPLRPARLAPEREHSSRTDESESAMHPSTTSSKGTATSLHVRQRWPSPTIQAAPHSTRW
ncbi:MAG: hypothetical protein MZV64_35515 [Ignavibacteriales bacterium]|nr:hypothetical protein [Ignavibacteriales bacterium]